METKPNDFTFPHSLGDVTQYQHIDCGLTKREYFAVMALQGLVSNKGSYFPDCENTGKLVAQASIKYADALILELNKSAALKEDDLNK